MINTSSEYKEKILENRKFHLYATITLLDGTVLNLTDDDIMQGGMEFEDAVSGDGALQIGAAIIGKNVLTLNNYDGKFDAYDFTGATVVPYVGLELSSTVEKLKKGFFTVDDPNVAGNLLVLESLDNMTKFEKDFLGVSISFPNTALAVLLAICDYCGVTLSTNNFTNYDYIIQSKPTSDALTCLDMVSYIAQIAGCFARCNVNGDLKIKWYDLTAFETSEDSIDGGNFDDAKIEITKIEGAYQQSGTPASENPTPITIPSNFNLTASNGTDSNSVHIPYELGALPSGVKNTIEKGTDGKTRLIQRIGKIVFDGSSDEGWVSITTSINGKNRFRIPVDNIKMSASVEAKANVICDKFCAKTEVDTWFNNDGICILSYANDIVIYYGLYANSLDQFKTWLASNPVVVYYELATPIETIISDIYLTSYSGTTNITTDSSPQVNVTYKYIYSNGDTADGGNFIDYSSGASVDGGTFENQNKYHHLYNFNTNPTVGTDDVVITGIQVSDNAETPNKVLFGSEGYILSISGNPLIQSQSDATIIASSIGAKIVGMRFRPFSASILSDPSIEAGDAAHVSVRTNRGYFTYHSYITSASYKVNSRETVKCDAETPSKNSATGYSALTKAIVETRKNTEIQLTSYDLAVQRMNRLAANTLGYHFTEVKQEDGSSITYRHDKPLLADSMIIYKEGIDGFFVSTDGGKTYANGFDSNGNAVLNILDAIGVKANWIRTGKLLSTDGGTIIDMAYGVANSDNISFADNIQNGYPLTMPFNIDSAVSKVNSVLLKYTQQNFRTYSTTASSGGGSTETSSTLAGTRYPTTESGAQQLTIPISFSGYTGDAAAYSPHHHEYGFSATSYVQVYSHTHGVDWPSHSHTVDIPSHSHELNFGIKEQEISDYSFDVYVDGAKQVTVANSSENAQGIIDLTAYITTVGWHAIEIRSTTLKRVSAQINIKSYIRS